MSQPKPLCMFCSHYQFQGRRGGTCQLFNVPVCGSWQACSQMRRLTAQSVPAQPHSALQSYGERARHSLKLAS